MKRLYRSETNKIMAGVAGGLGEYYDKDPVLIRVGLVLLALLTGVVPLLLAYVVAIFIIPVKPIGTL